MKNILIFVMTFCSLTAFADVMKDFDGLGENKDLFDTAKALHPDMSVSVVQERVVQRRHRLELAPEISRVTGGDAYLTTAGYGLAVHYHIRPWISLGARYTQFSNNFNREAKNLINDVDANGIGIIPDTDYAINSTMGLVNIYPIYGKMNTLNIGITHFDLYFTGGYGTMNLRRGGTNTWTAGGGVALWWSQHFTTRFELRYQTYQAKYLSGNRDLDTTIGSLQVGYLL